MNPITLLDNLLNDYASPKVRRAIHSLIALGVLIFTAYEAADGDWKKAGLALALALYAAANKANTDTATLAPAGEDYEGDDDGDTYEEAGGNPFPGA